MPVMQSYHKTARKFIINWSHLICFRTSTNSMAMFQFIDVYILYPRAVARLKYLGRAFTLIALPA